MNYESFGIGYVDWRLHVHDVSDRVSGGHAGRAQGMRTYGQHAAVRELQVSGWPAGYHTTVVPGHCDRCGQFRRVRQFAFDVNDNHTLEWLCKGCAKNDRRRSEQPANG